MEREWVGGLCGSTHCGDLAVTENSQFVSYEPIARCESARLLIFDGVAARFCRAKDAATLFGDDRNGVTRACFVVCTLH
jgi:hypothetical protein